MAGSNQMIAMDSRLRCPRLQVAGSLGEVCTCVPQVPFVCILEISWKNSQTTSTCAFQCTPLSFRMIGEVISRGTRRIEVRICSHKKEALRECIATKGFCQIFQEGSSLEKTGYLGLYSHHPAVLRYHSRWSSSQIHLPLLLVPLC
jgi:hypothetical protein